MSAIFLLPGRLTTDLESIPHASTPTSIIPARFEVDMTIYCRVKAFLSADTSRELVTLTFDLLTLNICHACRVTWPTLPPSTKTLSLSVLELLVITFTIGYHWKCLRGHWACAESRDPCVPRRTANTMTYCPTWHAGIIINKSGKFEDIVLMIAKRQAYRHRDGDIIQACNRIVFCQRRC